MGKVYFTMQEIQTLKVYELPTMVYEKVFSELEKTLGTLMPQSLRNIFDNARIMEIDQYVDLYKIIRVI